eukprot:2531990-Rhodomonas_salina.2
MEVRPQHSPGQATRRVMEFKRQEDIEGQGEDGGEEGEEQLCRICFAKERTENLIKPCLCTAMVHRNCLDEWRAQEQFPHAFTHCPTCKYQYQTTILEDNAQQAYWARWRFRFFVARDMGGVFLGVQVLMIGGQLFIMGFAKVPHCCLPTRADATVTVQKRARSALITASAVG